MTKHKLISFIKSGVRIAGCALGMYSFHAWLFPFHAFAFLLLAEVLGIVEEFYEPPAPAWSDDDIDAFAVATRKAGGELHSFIGDKLTVYNLATGNTITMSARDASIPGFILGRIAADTARAGSKGQVK
jgi:hypothetical protein